MKIIGLPAVMAAIIVLYMHGSAHAEQSSVSVDTPFPVTIHPAILTAVRFPDAVERVRVLDELRVLVWAKESTVYIQPREDAPPGYELELQVLTATMSKRITLRVVERAEEAAQHVSLTSIPAATPIELPQEHIMTAPARPAAHGRPRRARPPARPAPRSTSPRLGLSVQGTVGLARVGDAALTGHDETYLTGTAARVSYAAHERFAFDIELAMARSGSARFADVAWMGETGDMKRITEFGRALMGVRLRLGATITPTLHLAVGGQTRPATPSVIVLDGGSVVPGPSTSRSWDVMVAAGLGLEIPLAASWLAGASVSAVQAFPVRGTRFQSIEGSAYVAHHWNW